MDRIIVYLGNYEKHANMVCGRNAELCNGGSKSWGKLTVATKNETSESMKGSTDIKIWCVWWLQNRVLLVIRHHAQNTGCFIRFSLITNIYNKKTKRTYLNGIVHSHRKTGKVLLTTRDVRCVHHG
jgi:hypothetical protein